MDRELPTEIIQRKRIKRYVILAGVVLAVVLVYVGFSALLRPTIDRTHILTSVAEIGPIEATVSASGVVVPEFEQILTAPITSTIADVHIHPGDSVHAGESILQLNTEQLQLAYQQASDQLNIQKNKKEQMTLELRRQREDLVASRDIKIAQEKYAESKYDRAKHLFDIGGITKADFDLAALDLEIAKRELKQLSDQVDNKDESIAASLREIDLQISVEQNRCNEIKRQLDLAEAHAGRDGILTWVNDAIGSPVNPGEIVARIADLSSFKVEATISDIHVGKLHVAGPVNVRIRDKELRGTISAIQPNVQNGVVTFEVALTDRSNDALHPNLRTDVYVVTSTVDNVVRVKNGPFYNGSVDQEIFVVDGDRAVRKVVDIGVSNIEWVEIKDGITPGETIIVSDTKKYRHLDDIAIN